MGYSRWFVNNANQLLKVTVTNNNFNELVKAINEACNNTVTATARTCSTSSLLYKCSGSLSASSMTLFSCNGYVNSDCDTSNAACQTAGLVNDTMVACMQNGMNHYAQTSNMSCRPNTEDYPFWLVLSLVSLIPLTIFGFHSLFNIISDCINTEKKESSETDSTLHEVQIKQ